MRYALIDNSALTAVQRVLGQIPIQNKYLIHADIPALESLIQAILFYDNLLFLDDYKEEYRESRAAFFNRMMGWRLSEQGYRALGAQAKEITEDIVLSVAGGRITGDIFAPFFEMLRLHLTFTWDMHSSVFYLTIKVLEGLTGLDRRKYGRLASMIYAELLEKSDTIDVDVDLEPILYDSRGNRILSNYEVDGRDSVIAEETRAFFASLNWLAFRTILYTLLARQLDIDLFLHPIRNSFQARFLEKFGRGDPSIFRPIIMAMNGEVNEAINRVFQVTQPFILYQDLPMFTVWLAKKTGDPDLFIDTAYELRSDKIFGCPEKID